MTSRRYPSLYQINTRVWLTELSRKMGRAATLDDIPDAELNRIAKMGFDWIWFLSVWQTGPAAQKIIQSLRKLYSYYGNDFKIECPTGSGRVMTLWEVANEIARRLANIFLRDKNGRRPVYGNTAKFQDDPHWRDLILFYEYFHGDNGAGIGARRGGRDWWRGRSSPSWFSSPRKCYRRVLKRPP